MSNPDFSDSNASSAMDVCRRRSAIRANLVVVLCGGVFCGLGAWAYHDGDGSAPVIFAMIAIFAALFVYGLIHKRGMPDVGPPDPSAQWRLSAGAADEAEWVYRYSRGMIVIVQVCAWSSVLLGLAVYVLSRPGFSGVERYTFALPWIGFSSCFFVAVEACKRYAVEVTHTEIVHHRVRKSLRFAYQNLGSVALLQGSGRGAQYVLAIFDTQGRCVDQFANTLDDFEGLVALVKLRAFEVGLPYSYRDRWGAWTK